MKCSGVMFVIVLTVLWLPGNLWARPTTAYEAEMVVTCSLPDVDVDEEKITVSDVPKEARDERQAKGTAKCSHCGNEADMWIDY